MASHNCHSSRRGKGGRTVFSEPEEIAIAIRAISEPKHELARELGVHRNTIGNICKRRERQARAAVAAGAEAPSGR